MLKLVVKIVGVIVVTGLILSATNGVGWPELLIIGVIGLLFIILLVVRYVQHSKESMTTSTS